MSSSHYVIQEDSVNSGGNSYSSSTNYKLGDTLGETGTGYSSSTNYSLSAGFWANSGVWISMTSGGNVSLGTLLGIGGGTATGSTSYVVTTNNNAGYQLIVQSQTSPALKSLTSSIPDYSPVGANPDFTFTLASTTDTRFGFSPEGADIVSKYKDNGSSCNTGTTDTSNACWDGFATSSKIIAQSSVANDPSGATTTIKYEVKFGSSSLVDPRNTYSASITVTALTL
jgi:hypothetical protein